MKAMKSEIKENVQGTNSKGKETRTQINGPCFFLLLPSWSRRKKQEFKKIRRGLGTSRAILSIPTLSGEEDEQEIENLFEKITKENFSNLAKEIDFQEVHESQRVLNKLDPRKHTPRHIIITLAKIKDKERILKAAREKETVTYKGVPIRLPADFSKNA